MPLVFGRFWFFGLVDSREYNVNQRYDCDIIYSCLPRPQNHNQVCVCVCMVGCEAWIFMMFSVDFCCACPHHYFVTLFDELKQKIWIAPVQNCWIFAKAAVINSTHNMIIGPMGSDAKSERGVSVSTTLTVRSRVFIHFNDSLLVAKPTKKYLLPLYRCTIEINWF